MFPSTGSATKVAATLALAAGLLLALRYGPGSLTAPLMVMGGVGAGRLLRRRIALGPFGAGGALGFVGFIGPEPIGAGLASAAALGWPESLGFSASRFVPRALLYGFLGHMIAVCLGMSAKRPAGQQVYNMAVVSASSGAMALAILWLFDPRPGVLPGMGELIAQAVAAGLGAALPSLAARHVGRGPDAPEREGHEG